MRNMIIAAVIALLLANTVGAVAGITGPGA